MTPRWYCVSRDGLATLCSGEANARDVASENDIAWPLNAPHCAVLLVDTTEIERLRARLGQAADKALTYAESYEMAVARLVLALDYMHPEQKRAFNGAWAEKRAELRALKA